MQLSKRAGQAGLRPGEPVVDRITIASPISRPRIVSA